MSQLLCADEYERFEMSVINAKKRTCKITSGKRTCRSHTIGKTDFTPTSVVTNYVKSLYNWVDLRNNCGISRISNTSVSGTESTSLTKPTLFTPTVVITNCAKRWILLGEKNRNKLYCGKSNETVSDTYRF